MVGPPLLFCNVFMLFLTENLVVSLALICSFSRMRTHLGLGDAKPEDVPEDTVMAVAETLRTSSFLKISEDGEILRLCAVWFIRIMKGYCVAFTKTCFWVIYLFLSLHFREAGW